MKSGTYKYNPKTGEVEKVSDRIPRLLSSELYCPSGGYFSEHLDCFVRNRRHKAEILERENLREVGNRFSGEV